MRETASLLAASVDRRGADFSKSVQLTEQNAAQVFNMCIHRQRFIEVKTKVSNRLREWYITTRDGHMGKVRDNLT